MLGHSACLPGEVGTRPAIRIAGRRQPLIRTRVSIRRPGKVVRGGVATAVQTPASQASIVLPLNYAQLLGLGTRELCGETQIQKAHDAVAGEQLEIPYSPLAQLGRDKVLYAAREGLRMARGRVRSLSPDIAIEPLLLPGALALLEQLGAYDLVVALGEAASSTPQLRGASREDELNWSRDCALALALARCGRARVALDEGSPARASAEMVAALETLKRASKKGAPLAPDLAEELSSGISAFRWAALVESLRATPVDEQRRQAAVLELGAALMGQQSALPSFLGRRSPNQPTITLPDAQSALAALSVDELAHVINWKLVAADQASFSWCSEELLIEVVHACIVTGFLEREPQLIEEALAVANALHSHVDMAIQMAACHVLLGAPEVALTILQEDEGIGQGLGHVPREDLSVRDFPMRDEVMAWIRACEAGDLLPGLCAFVEKWINEKAIPSMAARPLAQAANTLGEPALSAYFEDPTVQFTLSSKETQANGILSWLSKLRSVSGGVEDDEPLARKFNVKPDRRAVYAAVGFATVVAVALAGMWPSGQQAATPGALELPAAQTMGTAAIAHDHIRREPDSRLQQTMTRKTAEAIIREWLGAKVRAMGPRHVLDGLSNVLAEPMLSRVLSEARDAAMSGWFWNIRPLKTKASEISGPRSDGSVTVLASVEEAAELWASNGRKGDSYHTTYQVEYTMKCDAGKWRIAQALVLGG